MAIAGSIQNYPPVQKYVELRKRLNDDISAQHLLGSHAVQVDDQVTLKQDWTSHSPSGDVVYKAGTSYSLDPYSNRDASHENITCEAGGETVMIQHDYDPHFFSVDERLAVDSVGRGGFIGSGGSFSMSQESYGLRPHGWMQSVLEEQGPDGYLLRM